jgi:signal transduction histidine kinase
MASSGYYNYYKIGRIIFALAVLISFQMVGLLAATHGLFYILIIYCLVAFVRVFMSNGAVGYFDFIFDIVFITAIIHVSFGAYSYMTLFYLFPIFISSIAIKNRKIFLFPIIAVLFYAAVYIVHGSLFERESLLSISLHAFSFFLIAFAGNSLNERIDRQERYIKSLEEEHIKMQGYERLYRVSADLAHELRNPLASISAVVQFLREGKNSSDFIEMLGMETARLTHLVNDFLMFSRPSDAPKEPVDLSALIEVVIARLHSDKKISADIEKDIVLISNRVYLDAALNNIVINAVESARSLVTVTLKRTKSYSDRNKDGIVLEVEDDGPGIDPSIRDRIFDPFFTTKQNGTGLGLAIAYRVITSYGGFIIADRSRHGGAKMTVAFPDAQ